MGIQLVSAEELQTPKKRTRPKGPKYAKYATAIRKHVPWIKEQIENSEDGVIRVKVADMGREMGGEFVHKSPTTLYWALKFVLYQHGIIVETGTHKSGEKLLVMRLGTEDDELPESLSKYLRAAEEGEEGEEGEGEEGEGEEGEGEEGAGGEGAGGEGAEAEGSEVTGVEGEKVE